MREKTLQFCGFSSSVYCFPSRTVYTERTYQQPQGVCSPGSSFPSGGENKRPRDPQAEIREFREELERYKSVEKRQGTQREPAGGEGGLQEDWKMEIDEEVDSKKSRISERNSCKNSCETLRGSQIYREAHRRYSKKCGSKKCKILSKCGMISGASKAAEEVSNNAKFAGQKRSSARKTLANVLKKQRGSETKLQKKCSISRAGTQDPEFFFGRRGSG